jgi:hypothetical protein
MRRLVQAICLLIQLVLASAAAGHEMRPAYLAMQEIAPETFATLWKVPALGDKRLGLYVRLPATCTAKADPMRAFEGNVYTERWTAICQGGLKEKAISIDGLSATLTDALARIEYLDGSVEIARLKPDSPSFVVAGAQSLWEVAQTYFGLGVDHILSGYDHLLFVLIRNRWLLVKTITAFTVAHSITLAGASLGYLSLPQKPVEAAIALSIAFVASELIKLRNGEPRLSEQYPWVVSFTFGLLHGFGFAGALKEIGLPQTDIPIALLTFNLGVEAGQLLFVAFVLAAFRAARALFTIPVAPARFLAGYAIGTMSMVWLVARLGSFGAGL